MVNLPAKTPEAAAEKRTFTGNKLDWMTALSADPRIDARAFEVGFQIAQHVNMETGVAFLSDDTISDKTGIPRRWVQRARACLKALHWIDWEHTKTANRYWTLGDNLNAVLDHQILLRESRAERRAKAKSIRQTAPPMAHLRNWDTPQVAHATSPRVAIPTSPQVANIHLSRNTSVDTPED